MCSETLFLVDLEDLVHGSLTTLQLFAHCLFSVMSLYIYKRIQK